MSDKIFGCCILGVLIGFLMMISGMMYAPVGGIGVVVCVASMILLFITLCLDVVIYLIR